MDKKDLYYKMVTAYSGILNIERHFEDMGFDTVGSVLSNDVADSVFSVLLDALGLHPGEADDNWVSDYGDPNDSVTYDDLNGLTRELYDADDPAWDELWDRFHTA